MDFINVNVHGKDYYFPCYEWVTNGFITPNSTTALPHHEENDLLKHFRSESLLKERSKHSWAAAEDIVGHMTGHLTAEKELPRNTQWSLDRPSEEKEKSACGMRNLMLNKFLGIFRNFDSLDDVQKATDLKNSQFRQK